MPEILDDIQETFESRHSDVLISNVDNSLASQVSTQRLFAHIEFLKSKNIRERILCPEGTKHVLSPADECRWLAKELTQNAIPTVIYGNKVALQLWDQSMFVLIHSAEAANAERKRFETLWSIANGPTKA